MTRVDFAGPDLDEVTVIDGILKIVTATTKSELEKLCKSTVITEDAFSEFIRVCQASVLPWFHLISYRDFHPKNLSLTSEDSSKIPDLSIGPPKKEEDKAMKKFNQFFHDRRYLVGHLFFNPKHCNWPFFYFDNRDLSPYGNHFKRGPHVHLMNHLWPQHTYKSVWKEFNEGNPRMKGAVHIRFNREHTVTPSI